MVLFNRWKRESFFGRKHDMLLWYSKGDDYYFDGKSPLVVIKRKANSHMKTMIDDDGREYQEKEIRNLEKCIDTM